MHPTQTFSYAQSLEPVKLLAMTNRSDATTPNIVGKTMLQNSPQFCVFKYARAVKQKVWNEAENRELDFFFSRLTRPTGGRVRLARFEHVRPLRHVLRISLLILRKKTDCFEVQPNNVGSCCVRLPQPIRSHLARKLVSEAKTQGRNMILSRL